MESRHARWLEVDRAIARAVAPSSGDLRAIDVETMAGSLSWVTWVRPREITCFPTGRPGSSKAPSPEDRVGARGLDTVRMLLMRLESETQRRITVLGALGWSYRAIAKHLRREGLPIDDKSIPILHRYGRERIERGMREAGLL